MDVENNKFTYVYAKCVLVFRNYNDYSYYVTDKKNGKNSYSSIYNKFF